MLTQIQPGTNTLALALSGTGAAAAAAAAAPVTATSSGRVVFTRALDLDVPRHFVRAGRSLHFRRIPDFDAGIRDEDFSFAEGEGFLVVAVEGVLFLLGFDDRFVLVFVAFFVVGAAVVGAFASDDADYDTADHDEPGYGDALEGEQQAEEEPADAGVEGNGFCARVEERLEEGFEHAGVGAVGEEHGAGVCGLRGGFGGVGAVGHRYRVDVGVYGVADCEVGNVAGEEPGDDEDGEGGVAGALVVEVAEDFGGLDGSNS